MIGCEEASPRAGHRSMLDLARKVPEEMPAMRDEIAELQHWYDEGSITKAEHYFRLAEICGSQDPEAVVAALPDTLRLEFLQWLQNSIAADDLPEDVLWITSSGRGDVSRPDLVRRLRAWLERRSQE
jgi:hypothetical protein